MAGQSIPQNDEVWDAHYSLRTTIRRQAQQIKVQDDRIAELTKRADNLTASVAALLRYLEPRDGETVYSPDCPPEWMPLEPKAPTYGEYTALLYEIPAEVVRHGR